MSTKTSGGMPARRSFAQVAAAANMAQAQKEKPSSTQTQTSSKSKIKAQPSDIDAPPGPSVEPNVVEGDNLPSLLNVEVVQTTPSITETGVAVELADEVRSMKIEDRSGNISRDESAAKKDNSDIKSVASRTTYTLDEKESLKPDDSASMQAATEEDNLSPSSSAVADSRGNSDPDARAFRDQLHEIDRTGNARLVAQRDPVPVNRAPLVQRSGGVVCPQPAIPTVFKQIQVANGSQPRAVVNPVVAPPDEKLLEALASPKDRLFVLKIEQDFIDFIKDSKEEFLQLPQTNSFYRMLSHKLADYYFLGHLIDESLTSVRIYRTPNCRLPPPLIDTIPAADGNTILPTQQVSRKIMKRNAVDASGQIIIDGTEKSLNSQISSKAPSDSGNVSPEENQPPSRGAEKAALTREERENRYNEVRARIFKDFEEKDLKAQEAAVAQSDQEPSRSSSVSDAKKNKKKKKPKDDGFEGRSAYNQLGGQQYAPNSMPPPVHEGVLYENYGGYPVTSPFHPQIPSYSAMPPPPMTEFAPVGYNNAFPYNPWPQQQPGDGYVVSPEGAANSGYFSVSDNGAYNGNQSYPSPNLASQITPKLGSQALASYSQGFQHQPNGMAWTQDNYNAQYAAHGYFNGEQPPNYQESQMMFIPPTNQFPGYYPTGSQWYPPQFSYGNTNRQQFNPRSQSFVPGQRGPYPQAQPGFVPFHSPNMTSRYTMQRQPSNASQVSGLNSNPHFPQQQNLNGTSKSAKPSQKPSQGQNGNNNNGNKSSIPKWGNPSSLPPKPPPPAAQTSGVAMPKDINNLQQPLPPNPYTNGAMKTTNASNST